MSKGKCMNLISMVCSKHNDFETGPPQKNQQPSFHYQDTRLLEKISQRSHIEIYDSSSYCL